MNPEQDREFEHYLEGGSGLSDAYARLPEAGPPAHLDHAILAEAHRAVRARPGRSAWRRWSVPLSVAATLIVAILVGLEQFHTPVEEARVAAPAPAVPEKANQDQVAAPAAHREAGPAPREAKPAARSAAQPPASAQGMAAKQGAAEGEVAQPAATAPVLQDSARMRTAPARIAPPASGEMKEEVAPAAEMRAAPAPAAPAPAMEAAPAEPQQAWLERIRQLKREGKREEARKALAAFGRKYPGYPVPADLRDLR